MSKNIINSDQVAESSQDKYDKCQKDIRNKLILRRSDSTNIEFKSFVDAKTKAEKQDFVTRLYDTLGTADSDLSSVLIEKLLTLYGTQDFSSKEMNGALGFLQDMKPADPAEAILLTQMYGTHLLSCKTMGNANIPGQISEGVTDNINRATKLSRTYMAQMDALKKYRGKGQQKITVEHVNVNEGGKAIIGDINNTVIKGGGKNENQR
ncbi:MAG: hypothetical protein HON23_05870 [Rickettsiales bacterium]|jgi:hypothetical protein|nr:hypothetical protein [Rickettsiales bacterium]